MDRFAFTALTHVYVHTGLKPKNLSNTAKREEKWKMEGKGLSLCREIHHYTLLVRLLLYRLLRGPLLGLIV